MTIRSTSVHDLYLLAHQPAGQTVRPGAIVDNKRSSAVLEQVKA
jgi:hypothetical protein